MNAKITIVFIFLTGITVLNCKKAYAVDKPKPNYREMILEDFMEDYVKPAAKQSQRGFDDQVIGVLKLIPDLSLPEQKEEWTIIVNSALKSGKYGHSCKGCHKKYKKPYHKTYNKRLVKIPKDIDKLFGY
ncbi:MAG: hypothetical protein H7A23_08330 [Leptospiraceae bacterium]|nr:hypothetical protein [Leptospiraceae bacterium]MCP5494552.1 hypothetical protein [Leptospiraceae bacterium]